MGMSDYLKHKHLDAEWNAQAFSVSQVYLQLHNGEPGASGTDNVVSIARQAVPKGAAGSGQFDTDSDIAYANMPADEDITHFSTWDAAGTGTPPTGGNLLRTGAFVSPYPVTTGSTFRVLAGDLINSIS